MGTHTSTLRTLAIVSVLTLLCGRATPVAAQEKSSHSHSHWSDGHRSLDVLIDGEIEVTDDAADIARLVPGSRMTVDETKGGKTWRARFTPDANGGVRREYWLNEAPSSLAAIGPERVRDVLEEIIREEAIGAEGRVKRLFAKGGVSAVLKDIAEVHSDGAQRKYYTILAQQQLRGEDVAKVVSQAVHNMHSDGDRRNVLFAYMQRRDLSTGAQEAILRGAAQLNSDGDKSRVLDHFAADHALDDRALRSAFFTSTETINSDGDKRRVLLTLLRLYGDRKPVVQDVVLAARTINSDGDKSAVLLRVPIEQLRDHEISKLYVETLNTINSSGDRVRVQSYLLRSDVPDTSKRPSKS